MTTLTKMARQSNKATAIRLAARSLRTIAATEPDRELALRMLSVAEDMERHAEELERRFSGSRSSRAFPSQSS
jgi:hypothetical protein